MLGICTEHRIGECGYPRILIGNGLGILLFGKAGSAIFTKYHLTNKRIPALWASFLISRWKFGGHDSQLIENFACKEDKGDSFLIQDVTGVALSRSM